MIATLACVLGLTACGGGDDNKTATTETPQPAYAKTDLVTGTGETAANGDLVTILYTGYLYDSTKANGRGAQFETSPTGAGVSFAVATGAVPIKGWDQGVLGMKVGGKANLVLPSSLAFGAAGYTSTTGVKVAANAPLVFEVELIAVKKASPSATVTIKDNVVGTGAEAVLSKTLTVHYTGWLYDETKADFKGTKFDSSVDKGQTFDFAIGTATVIKGWDRGVLGMKVGGKRTLIVPSELGYGSAGTKDANGAVVIPPNAKLIFDIELIAVK
ncbi:FKBP-type peptidyl-prolyl cis-trans isomerase [Pseudoduganella namucuonensis]|nr:FKBP-type peptidyl-prolyl cis-trans isomerase [Pseudoduganella namucuonensis]